MHLHKIMEKVILFLALYQNSRLRHLPDQPLEGHLPNEQLGALLVLANFTGGGDREVQIKENKHA